MTKNEREKIAEDIGHAISDGDPAAIPYILDDLPESDQDEVLDGLEPHVALVAGYQQVLRARDSLVRVDPALLNDEARATRAATLAEMDRLLLDPRGGLANLRRIVSRTRRAEIGIAMVSDDDRG